MMPVQWNRGVEVIDKVQRFDGTTVTERRSAMHAASGVGLDEQADPRLMPPSKPEPLRIVALSWRDLVNLSAGGAEVLIDRLLLGLDAGATT